MSSTFDQYAVRADLIKWLRERGIEQPTWVQAQAIPLLAAGKDALVQSQTGTGKTLAYLLPVMQNIDAKANGLQAVVLAPTRELCMQIFREAEQIGAVLGVSAQALIGGAALHRQIDKLRMHPQLIVGTPGRIAELIKMKKIKLHTVRSVVIDEADQMFALGSLNELELILHRLPRERQMAFFSATLPEPVYEIAARWMNEPARISASSETATPANIQHLYFVCEDRDKIDMLRRIVRYFNPKTAFVFINNTDDTAELLAKLQYLGLAAEALYGDSFKSNRAAVLDRFRRGKFQLLIATDVAARGLDIGGLTHVINFDPPVDADHYLHRIGRTGRMGRQGTAISLITEKQRFIMSKFAKTLGIDIKAKSLQGGELADQLGEMRQQGDLSPKAPLRKPLPESPTLRGIANQAEPATSAVTASSPNSRKSPPVKRAQAAAAKPPASRPNRRRERERDRKNKGAPRWLKEKQQSKQT